RLTGRRAPVRALVAPAGPADRLRRAGALARVPACTAGAALAVVVPGPVLARVCGVFTSIFDLAPPGFPRLWDLRRERCEPPVHQRRRGRPVVANPGRYGARDPWEIIGAGPLARPIAHPGCLSAVGRCRV